VVVGAKSDKEISDAVKECLNRCYASGHTPLGEMAEYLLELRRQGWSDLDIKLAEQSARKLLAGIMQPNGEDDSGAQ
jgi:hypothetical protein